MKNSISYKTLARYKYELTHSCTYKTNIKLKKAVSNDYIMLYNDGTLYIRKGYAWDGASGVPDTTTNIRASLFHDALYQLIRDGLISNKYRKAADKLYRRICRDDGMLWVRAFIHYLGLRLLGSGYARKDDDADD